MSLLGHLFKPRRAAAKSPAKARLTQLASAGPLLRGKLHAKAAGYFGGDLTGDLSADEEFWLEPGGVIRGDLRGGDFSIEGTVRGDIHASGGVALKNRSRLRGDIHAHALSIEPGAHFSGRLVIGGAAADLTLNLQSKA
ncbi:MAG: polymer-forming cytoskeletal protein [Verrucomicrobiales bacterium]|jgi:cytoskeletal protein CcmA (bactofilin family)|nr:polymer-forming cytoskeletal protein [Verrucomicrobiales bacterium]